MRVSIFAPLNMKVDIDCAVNLENTHMDGHGMSLSDHVTGVGRAYCSGDRIISLGTIEHRFGMQLLTW
jgi:hypothetical protein